MKQKDLTDSRKNGYNVHYHIKTAEQWERQKVRNYEEMGIVYHESSKVFHLYNDTISYFMTVLKNGHLGQLYFGKRIRGKSIK